MLSVFRAAISGMLAHKFRMDVIGNNLANVSTPGFKATRAEFRDLPYEAMPNSQPPPGVEPEQQAAPVVVAPHRQLSEPALGLVLRCAAVALSRQDDAAVDAALRAHEAQVALDASALLRSEPRGAVDQPPRRRGGRLAGAGRERRQREEHRGSGAEQRGTMRRHGPILASPPAGR